MKRYLSPRQICIHRVDDFIEPLEKTARKYDVSINQILRRLAVEFTTDRGLRMKVVREIQGTAKVKEANTEN